MPGSEFKTSFNRLLNNRKQYKHLLNNNDGIDSILIVTPCKNAIHLIDKTILSVITQSGDFIIYFHVHDYGSTDGDQATDGRP